jgi:hypothetical protein
VTDPDSDLTSETRALLDLARGGDALPRAHRSVLRRRLAGALGLAAPLAISTSAAASVALWVARGLAVIGTAGVVHVAAHGGIASMRSEHVSPAPRATVVVQPVVPAPTVTPSALPPPPPSASAPLEPPPPPPPAPSALVHARPRAAPAPALADALTDEVRLVADARGALESGDGARALSLLAEHDRRFAAGVLSPEAEALRVEALCRVGRTDEAQVQAARFTDRHPGSPLARRFAAACGTP